MPMPKDPEKRELWRSRLSSALKGNQSHLGMRHSDATKCKITQSQKGLCSGDKHPMYGKHHSEKARRKISESLKGNILWNKGKIGVYSKATLKLMSENNGRFNKGRSPSKNTRRKISEAQKGKYVSPETREKQSRAHRIDGGLTPLAEIIRATVTYKLWRKAVFIRDHFQCQDCGKIGGRLNAHHPHPFIKLLQDYGIISFGQAIRTEELWDIALGVTLCIKCHKKRHKKRSQTLAKEAENFSDSGHKA